MSWRPNNWITFLYAKIQERIGAFTGREKDAGEAGADAMHKADVEWMKDRLKMRADGNIEILATQTDWQFFKEV